VGAGLDAHPRFGPILFSLAVLVVSAKVGGLLAERWHQPPVLGELMAGIALANLLPLSFEADRLAFIRADPTLRQSGDMGVARLHLQHLLTAVALNVVRLGACWPGTSPAKTRCSFFAALRGAVA
jgi:hypothetical protein